MSHLFYNEYTKYVGQGEAVALKKCRTLIKTLMEGIPDPDKTHTAACGMHVVDGNCPELKQMDIQKSWGMVLLCLSVKPSNGEQNISRNKQKSQQSTSCTSTPVSDLSINNRMIVF